LDAESQKPQARPAYRTLALAVGVVCGLLAFACATFGVLAGEESSLFAATASASVSAFMLGIWRTGRLNRPPRRGEPGDKRE